MDFDRDDNSLNINDLDAYYLNSKLYTDIKEYLHGYMCNLNFCSVKTLHFDYYSRTENINFSIPKTPRFLEEFYQRLGYELNRVFYEIFYDVLISKNSLVNKNKSVEELSKRKMKIQNLLNNTNYDFSQYLVSHINSFINSNTKAVYFGQDDISKYIKQKRMNPYLSYFDITNMDLSNKIWKRFEADNLTLNTLSLKEMFNNTIFLTNNNFIDFFLNDNTFYFRFKESYNRNIVLNKDMYPSPVSSVYNSYDTHIEFHLSLNLNYVTNMEIFKILKIIDK